MTTKERNANCYCDELPDTVSMCPSCEEYYDEREEQYEEAKRKRLFEEQEY